MTQLVLLVYLQTVIAVYPMPDLATCESWAGEAAAYPHVRTTECQLVDPSDLTGPGFVWQPGIEGVVL